MGQASTSRVQLRYIQETTWGTTPVAGNGLNLRCTGESLDFSLQKEESKEIRADRQINGATTVDATASGGLNIHLQYAEYDKLIAGALCSAWSVYGTAGVGTTFSGTYTATTITAGAAPVGANAFTTLQLGQWFRLLAPTSANDGLLLRVSTSVAPTSTVITLDTATPCAAAGPIANSAVQTSRLTNGVTEISFTLEKAFTDVTQVFTYKGMEVNKMTLNFAAAALADGSFDFIGKNAVRAAATALPGTIQASNSYNIQNGVKGINAIWENGAPLAGVFVKTMSLTVDNNLRSQKALANLGAIGIGQGDFKASGQMEMYFANGNMYDRFLTDTYTSVILPVQDSAGNGYVFSMPRVLLTNAKIVAGGENQDAMISFDFTAFADDANAVAALRQTIFIDRVGVAVP